MEEEGTEHTMERNYEKKERREGEVRQGRWKDKKRREYEGKRKSP